MTLLETQYDLRRDARKIASNAAIDLALGEFEAVHAFIYSRVGNGADADDLTQQVALKALPRLRDGAPASAVRGYLYATARSVLAEFWGDVYSHPKSGLDDEVWIAGRGGEVAAPTNVLAQVAGILESLGTNHRRVLELRFLRGYSVREVALEMGKTVAGVKVMQYRALRAAAALDASNLAKAVTC